jgi:rod shape-determining protein MreC
VRLVAVVVACLVLMTVDHRGQHLESFRGILATVVYPVQYAVNLPIQAGGWAGEQLSSRRALLAENERLRAEQLRVGSRMEKLAELESENRRLRSLLDSAARVGERVLIAELLAVDMDPFSRRIVLNKGTREGVHPGQSLVDSSGIMGQVVHAGPFSSNALLITDPSHALPVQLTRTALRAVAVGAGPSNLLRLVHVPNNADVEIGDLVVTSGLGGRFPPGYSVGRVLEVQRDRGQSFAEVTVRPSARLERNREVLLVWPDKPPAPAFLDSSLRRSALRP